MFPIFIILIIILNFSVCISLFSHKKIDNCFIATILLIIALFYVLGLVNMLSIGIYFVYALSIIVFIFNIFLIKKQGQAKELILTKGFFAFVFFFLLLCFFHRDRILTVWDEFSHWGDVVKAMFDINDFQTNPLSQSMFKSYPPAMSLFQYFFMQVDNYFHESFLYIAYDLVAICFLLPIISEEKSTKKYILLMLLILLVPMAFYNNYYSSILIDAMVGISFAYGIFILSKKRDSYDNIFLMLDLFALSLFKEVGVYFSIILVVLLIIQTIQELKNKKVDKNKLLIVLVAIIVIAFAKMSWDYDININNVVKSFGNKISLSDVFKLFSFQINDYRSEVISNFLHALHSTNILESFISLNFIRLMILYIFAFIVLLKKKLVSKANVYVYIVSGILYCIGLLVLYCFKFSEYEAVRLASYARYLSIYFTALNIILLVHVVKSQKGIYVYTLILLIITPFNNLLFIRDDIQKGHDNRLPYEESVAYIKSIANESDKVYIISQNNNGYDYWNIRFLVRPIIINESFTWSIGSKYSENDVWTKDITSQDFINYLIENHFKYVYIYKCDEKFKNEFGKIFNNISEISSRRLYQIDVKEKKLLLKIQ